MTVFYPVQEVTAFDDDAIVFTACIDTDTMQCYNDGSMFVLLKGGSAPASGGIVIEGEPALDSGRDGSRDVTVSAGSLSIAGPFPPRDWSKDLKLNINCPDATDLSIAIIRLLN